MAGARLGQKPIVTMVLIGINLAFFLVTALQARSAMDLAPSALYLQGGLIPAEVASGEYWRLLTAGFLHGNLIHIATNMISLYMLGMPLERILGRGRFLVIYLLSLLGSSVSVLLFSGPFVPTIGASGAIYGLMGALLVTFKRLGFDLRQLLIVVAHQRVHHLPVPRDLLAGAPGRAGGRRDRRRGDGLPAAAVPAGSGSGARRSGWWSCWRRW